MKHHQPHKQQCGRDIEGEKDMGGVEEARQSDKYRSVEKRHDEWMDKNRKGKRTVLKATQLLHRVTSRC